MADVIVFISYRRADTSADAGRLYDALRRRLGRENLFMDVDSIRPGEDWVEAVEEAVNKCDALLALIGPDWSDVRDDEGNRRLENDLDRVRLEIEAALKADKAVIPVLFEQARMPHSSDLPESLQPLLRRHAIRISHATFDNDLRGLLRALKLIEQAKEPEPTAEPEPPAPPPPPPPPPPAPVVEPEPAPAVEVAPEPPPPPVEPTPEPPPPPPPFAAPPPPPPAYVWAQPGASTPVGPVPQGGGEGNSRRLFVAAAIVVLVVLVALFGAYMLLPKPTPTPSPPPTVLPSVPPTSVATPSLTPGPSSSQSPTPSPTAQPSSPPPTGALDPLLAPRLGEVSLEAGFLPDPNTIILTTGGSIDVRYLGAPCIGFTDAAPDFRLRYTAAAAPLLRIYFEGEADTALVVNDPAGSWYCDDDSLAGLDPQVLRTEPTGGVYDIWVTSLSGAPISGTLSISERETTP